MKKIMIIWMYLFGSYTSRGLVGGWIHKQKEAIRHKRNKRRNKKLYGY